MATDDPNTDDETDERGRSDAERAGPDAERPSPGTYANAGREEQPEPATRRQAWDAQNDAPGDPDALRARTDRRPERRYGMGGYETGGRESDRPSQQPPQSSRRYGSKQSRDVQNNQVDSGKKQQSSQGEPVDVRGGESPRREKRRRTDEDRRVEETPPKRTQPLRGPTEPESSDRGRDGEPGSPRRRESELRGETERRPETERRSESDRGRRAESEQAEVPKYGGPRDRPRGRNRGQSVERQRRQREYERQFDRQRARQRDFQRDKSGGKYRRR
ncbi:hypothetical protein [Halorussus lipolyticus]|uniref:hypothetical protein n=1 Tax=Halorussus lipolyticus TaxID=3034024 RepID=UPI0023E80FC3|nr:hypothetical protein [Halorussus sp. DT80]